MVIIMPRQARIKSSIGIYHIMLRVVNGQQIFEEREDFEKFLQVLKDCKAISEFKVFAYCLMGNHIHILLQETNESVELIR
jgi:REP element-mobilizing transposase RayT